MDTCLADHLVGVDSRYHRVREAENVHVRLGTIPGRGPVLIRSTM
jgi:hypothetical protein